MPWESRGLRRYLYRCRRVNGLPRKLFLGAGAVAEAHERLIAEERRRREAERRAWQAELERLALADGIQGDLEAAATVLARAALILGGFHEHHRQWRRRK